MNDTTDRRRLLAGVLIAAGVLWFLVVTGFIPRRFVLVLFGFWPLLPIGIGLDMLLERKPFDVPFTALALLAMAVLAFAVPGGRVIEARYVEPIDGAVRAEVTLALSSSPTTLRSLVGGDLFRADIVDTREVRFDSRGDEVRRIVLEAAGPGGVGRNLGRQPRWDLRLNTDIPVALAVDAGSGRADLDLGGIRLETIGFDGASGSARLRLPNGGDSYTASFDLASGSSEITTDPGADLSIDASTGSGSSRWTFTRGTRLVMNLETASGSVTIDLPDNAAIVVRIEDDGSGSVTLPPFLERLEGQGERGVWRSRAADGEAVDIAITVTDVGSGSLSFR